MCDASFPVACFLDARMTKHTGFVKENDMELFFNAVENMRGIGEAGIRDFKVQFYKFRNGRGIYSQESAPL